MQSSSILSLHHAPVLLTLPQIVAGEAETLALLSNESDTLIHLRKPEASPEALEFLLQALVHQGADLSRFTLHYNEPLARRYGVGGVHLHPEELLKGLGCGLRRSTSTHSWAEAAQMASLCDYLFLSPLFDSISKPGYHSRFTPDEASAQLHPHHGQIVALGGITEQNIASVRQLGFDGAAVLGAVWAFHTPESGTTQSARLDPLATLNRYRRLSRKWRAAGGTLQFISDGDLHKAEAFLQGGGRWVQLRMKNALPAAILKRAEALRSLCRRYNALMILNDQPYLAVSARADGVHLGQQDMSPAEARKIVGEGCIIGSTANTLDQIVACNDTETDYIGLGPFRFTTTKSNLSPILGLEGYRTLFGAMAQQAISLPVVAIGGIGIADLPALQSVGVRGIALSGAIAQAEDAAQVTAEFLQALRTSSTPPILSTQALTSSCKQG